MSDFFEPGATYVRDEPYWAPEVLPVFRCEHVAANPRDGESRAFGFGNYATLCDADWFSTALTPYEWSPGWVRKTETTGDER